MASSLAAQLSRIAATSTHQLDLRAQRASHSQSLIFDRKVAGSQDFDTIFEICSEGFQELCSLDPRFTTFRQSIFSTQSKTEDRGQMTDSQNKELDNVLESFLALVGSRLLLNPAVKAVDWLIRRFRIHEHNTLALILTFLPYHTTPLFLNLLTILPEDLTSTLKFLYPYKRSLTLPPRRAIAHSATTNKHFFAALNNHVLLVGKCGCEYQGLVSFWAGITTEAVAGMLDSAKAGKLEIERRNKEDVLLRVLPILNDAFLLKDAPQLIVGSFMVCVVLANKGSLSEIVLDSLMEAVVGAWTEDTRVSGFTCLAVLAQHKKNAIPKRVTKSISRLQSCGNVLQEISGRYSVTQLTLQLVRGCASEIKKGRLEPYLAIVDEVIHRRFLGENSIVTAMSILLQAAEAARKGGHMNENFQQQFSGTLSGFNESEALSNLFKKALGDSSIDITALEMSLETVIATKAIEFTSATDIIMTDAPNTSEMEDTFSQALVTLCSQTTEETSFLHREATFAFGTLARVFLQVGNDKEKLSTFCDLPILKRDRALEKPLYFSFFVRLFSGPYPVAARAQAIRILTSSLHDFSHRNLDLQALLPFTIAALMDPSDKIRKEASALLAEIDRKCSKLKVDDQSDGITWAETGLYSSAEPSSGIKWLQACETHKIMRRILVPSLEEYVLDASHIRDVLANAIRGSRESMGGDLVKFTDTNLKRSVRHNLFIFLTSHVTELPLYSVKFRLLQILNEIGRVGSTSRTQALLPLFKQWQQLSSENVKAVSESEHIALNDLEEQMLSIITPKDAEAFDILFSSVLAQHGCNRSTFVDAAFNRLKTMWPSFKEDQQIAAAETLLEAALGDSKASSHLTPHTRSLLRNIELSGPVLVNFVNKAASSTGDLDFPEPARKKRRTSENKTLALSASDAEDTDRVIRRITFILEVVDGSKPEKHPALAKGLAQILSAVQQLKLRSHSEMSYLLTLILGILLAIVRTAKNTPPSKTDISAIRADLIIDCVRTSESPQVQNTALLLVAGLAALVPELVLHSVMPIFTFMGSSVLRKDDAYSSLAVDQTIDQVVPPLIQSLRKQKRDVVSSTSELLLSFTAAFEHIPSYRRLRLFETLIDKLGTTDFLFAVLAMLANKHGMGKDVVSLMTSLASNTDAETQLTTYSRYLDLVRDSLQPKPNLSRILLGIGSDDGRDPQSVAIDLLQVLSHLLRRASLANKMAKHFESDAAEPASEVSNSFSRILEQILHLTESTKTSKPLNKACGETLGTFLGTLSLVDFIDTVEVLMGRSNDDLRRRVVKLTENRIDTAHVNDNASRTRALKFSSVLVNVVQTSPDVLLKHTAVACLGKISEKFGKKDPATVISVAKVIASDHSIGQSDDRIRLLSVLCLASMTEVLGEGIIPVLPDILARSLDLLRLSLTAGEEKSSLHDAVFSLISTLLIHIPWMISGNHLDTILQLSFISAVRDIPEESSENRSEALQLLAKRVEAIEVFSAIERNWSSAAILGSKAIIEALSVTKAAIDKHPKSSTIKNVSVLMTILRGAFDLRRTQAIDANWEPEEIDKVDTLVNDVTVRMIYKLNDTVFRPLFTELTDWAVNGLGKKDRVGRLARMTSFFKFLETFFGTLKSIVTGYSSYILEHAVEVLKNAKVNDKNSKLLWLATLRALRSSFEHDRDEFWQSPTHLTTIAPPLIQQLSSATNSTTLSQVMAEVVPTIVGLAAAADSPDNHKELNTLIMGFTRAGGTKTGDIAVGDNPYTRLAAVKCEHSLTERLREEWLTLLPEMLPYISELMEDDDENIEKEVRKWVLTIEDVLGEKLDDMLV